MNRIKELWRTDRKRLIMPGIQVAFCLVAIAMLLRYAVFGNDLESEFFAEYQDTISLGEAMSLPGMTPERKANLALIRVIRNFGIGNLGMNKTDSYTRYQPKDIGKVGYRVVYSERSRVATPLEEVRTYGTREEAELRVVELRRAGYDATFGFVSGYYSPSERRDEPVLPKMLDIDEPVLIETVLHELAHGTIGNPDDGQFDESFATFVGMAGSLAFCRLKSVSSTPLCRSVGDMNHDKEIYLNLVYRSLAFAESRYSDRGISAEQARREVLEGICREWKDCRRQSRNSGYYCGAQDECRMDNATLLRFRDYCNIGPFQRLFLLVGGNWKRFVSLCRQAAESKDPFGEVERLGAMEILNRW